MGKLTTDKTARFKIVRDYLMIYEMIEEKILQPAAVRRGPAVNELGYGGDLWADTPGVGQIPSDLVATPDFSLVGAFSFGFVSKLGILAAGIAVFSVMPEPGEKVSTRS